MFDNVVCRECAKSIYGNEAVQSAVFHPSDAKFKCPASELSDKSCKSETVSYRAFFTGSCCEPASRWLTKNEKGKIHLSETEVLIYWTISGQKEKLKVVQRFCNKSMMDLRKAKEDSERLSKEKKEEERRIESNERTLENLKKANEQSRKNITKKSNEIGVLKKRIRELDEDYDSASKRMNQLSFEYFDVAKKEKIKRQNGMKVKIS